MPAAAAAAASSNSAGSTPSKKIATAPEKKYKCQFCNRAFSRSEHRSRHERSRKFIYFFFVDVGSNGGKVHALVAGSISFLADPLSFTLIDTKERPFKCQKCRSTFVRRDLLLRHDRTVHAKDGGIPLVSEVKRRSGAKSAAMAGPSKASVELDTATMEQMEASSEGNFDLETAAMLITDLHHKATAAAMANHDAEAEEASTAYSPDHTTMFDSSVSYLANPVPLPQMPWDFMSQSVIEPKAHSISSSLSGSQDSQLSQLSFNSGSTAQPNANQLPPLMERFPSAGDALAPALQSMNNSMPVSGSATPNGNGLSPFPFMMGPVSPVNYRRSPGPSQALTSPKAPQVKSDEEYNRIVATIREWDTTDQAIQSSFSLQSRTDINNFLASFFNLFHHHLPFLHPESFKPVEVPPPILLAVLSIGALYNFNEEQAYMLHIGSKRLVNQFLQNKESFSSRKCPLWMMQSTLLNMIFASWSGDAKGLEWACSIKSLLANVCRHIIFMSIPLLIPFRWYPVIDTS